MSDVVQKLTLLVEAKDGSEVVVDKIATGIQALPEVARSAGAAIGENISTAVFNSINPSAWSEGAQDIAGQIGRGLKGALRAELSQGLQDALHIDPGVASAIATSAANIGDIITGPIQKAITGKVGDIAGQLAVNLAASPIVAAIGPIFAGIGTTVGGIMTAAIAAAPLLLPVLLVAAIIAAIALVISDPTIPGKVAEIGVGIARGIIDGVIGLVGGALSLAGQLLGAVISAVVGIPAEILGQAAAIGIQIVSDVINGILGLVGGGIALGAQLITAVGNALISVPVKIIEEAAKIGAGIVGGIIDGILGIAAGTVSFVVQVTKAITDQIAKLGEFAISVLIKPDFSAFLPFAGLGFVPPEIIAAAEAAAKGKKASTFGVEHESLGFVRSAQQGGGGFAGGGPLTVNWVVQDEVLARLVLRLDELLGSEERVFQAQAPGS